MTEAEYLEKLRKRHQKKKEYRRTYYWNHRDTLLAKEKLRRRNRPLTEKELDCFVDLVTRYD